MYDKELLGVRDTMEDWKYYLKSGRKFGVQINHSVLQHILDHPKLSGRQMRQLETIQGYEFNIEYYPGTKNYIKDTLSRRSDYEKVPIPRLSIKRTPYYPTPRPPSLTAPRLSRPRRRTAPFSDERNTG